MERSLDKVVSNPFHCPSKRATKFCAAGGVCLLHSSEEQNATCREPFSLQEGESCGVDLHAELPGVGSGSVNGLVACADGLICRQRDDEIGSTGEKRKYCLPPRNCTSSFSLRCRSQLKSLYKCTKEANCVYNYYLVSRSRFLREDEDYAAFLAPLAPSSCAYTNCQAEYNSVVCCQNANEADTKADSPQNIPSNIKCEGGEVSKENHSSGFMQ
eukprot:TRINITY_DN7467_c0_g1_i1.p1 TRINITY_DN7467_c0_g1~~TRINITY_DN7467_c0_g1_i1.p1  ORF type:complete len:214 (-),score=39.23 TRINITY_DN7467_c0_g1_i1:233-874(-)